MIKNFLNPKGHQNPISASKVTAILLRGWILPIGEASSGEGLILQPAQQACFWRRHFSTMEPPVFVLPLSCYFQNCFCFQDWTYFSSRHKVLTTQNLKGPPFWWKFWKIVWMLILITQKKRPGALNTKQKTPALCNVPLLNKSRKTSKKWHFWKNGYFLQFFLIFFKNASL